MKRRSSLRVVPMVVLVLLGVGAARLGSMTPASQLVAAAGHFIELLSPELKARAALAFDGPERKDWHFVPRERPGVTFGQMNDLQKAAARDLLRAALSSRGMLKAESIMALDDVLRDMERAAGGSGAGRDPMAYTIAIYGTPAAKTPWGWKLEGHHISLNFSVAADGRIAVTPAFLGANPATVRHGPQAGKRVLSAEEDLGRDLVRSLDESQRKEAVLSGNVPAEILTMPGRGLDEAPAAGLAFDKMTPEQKAILLRLLEEYAGNLRHELASEQLQRIRDAGMEKVRFAWAGAIEPGRPHYYRISGSTFVIEYDNTQNDANHVHTVWHDRDRDFGRDLLGEHYKSDHAGHDK